jgi:hypothetical protein
MGLEPQLTIQAAVLNGFGQMFGLNIFASSQIGDCA